MQQQHRQAVAASDPARQRTLLQEMARAAGRPRDGWESLLSMNDESVDPVDHCAVMSEN